MNGEMDEIGILIPAETWEHVGIRKGDALEIFAHNNAIVIKKAVRLCLYCGALENLATIDSHSVCGSCLELLKEVLDNKE